MTDLPARISVDDLPNSRARQDARRAAEVKLDAAPQPKKPRRKPRHIESGIQRAVFKWARESAAYGIRPKLRNLYAVPNGGYRAGKEGALLVAEGVEAGVPDMNLAVVMPDRRGGIFPGLFIELKAPGGTLSEAQEDWGSRLEAEGYLVVTCWSFKACCETIEAYLDGKFWRNDQGKVVVDE